MEIRETDSKDNSNSKYFQFTTSGALDTTIEGEDEIICIADSETDDDVIFVEEVQGQQRVHQTFFVDIADSNSDSDTDVIQSDSSHESKPTLNLQDTVFLLPAKFETVGPSEQMEVDGNSARVNQANSGHGKRRNRRRKPPVVVDLTGEGANQDVEYEIPEPEPMQTDTVVNGSGDSEESVPSSVDDNVAQTSSQNKPKPPADIAEEYKMAGNNFFKSQEFYKALEMYTKAISVQQFVPAYYGNRSACYIMMGKFADAQLDARRSIQLDQNFDKGYARLFRSTLHLGDVSACEVLLTMIKELPDNVKKNVNVEKEKHDLGRLNGHLREIKKAIEKRDYRKGLFDATTALTIATVDYDLMVTKADMLYNLDRFQEAQDLVLEVLQKDNKIMEGWFLASKCHYQFENLDKALTFIKRALQYGPDSMRIQTFYKRVKLLIDLRAQGKETFDTSKFDESKAKYTEALNLLRQEDMKHDVIESKMWYNVSLIASKLGSSDQALEYCTKAVTLNPKYVKAFVSRANLYSAKEMYDESVRDYETVCKLDPANRDWKKLLQDAMMAAKIAKRKDYYKIVGVAKNASQEEIKKAYKKQALIYHPDRHSSAADSVQKENEKRFKELGEAYDVLTDIKKKSRYDLGEDLNDPSSGFETFDPTQIFNAFYASAQGPRHFRSYQQGPCGGSFHR